MVRNNTKIKVHLFEEKLKFLEEKFGEVKETITQVRSEVQELNRQIKELDLWRANISGRLSVVAILLFILQILNLLASLVKNFLLR
jgi:peptidoglycan hydrolase CwlO-like protein